MQQDASVSLGKFPRNRYKPPLPVDFAVDSLERTRRGTSEMSDKVTSEAERCRRLLKALSRCRAPIPGGGILARALHRTRRRARLARLDAEWRAGFVLPGTRDVGFVLVKIDVEGHERAVLEGARATLARFHPALVIETGHETIADRAAIAALLRGAGYDLVGVLLDHGVAPAGWDAYASGAAPCVPGEVHNLLVLPSPASRPEGRVAG